MHYICIIKIQKLQTILDEMKKYYLLFILLLGACEPKEQLKGIFITGDYTGVMRVWRGERNETQMVANFSDSSKIGYPAYYLEINPKYGVLHVQNNQTSAKEFYYTLNPSYTISAKEHLRVSNLKLISGRGILNNSEILNPDDTKNVILDGGIQK